MASLTAPELEGLGTLVCLLSWQIPGCTRKKGSLINLVYIPTRICWQTHSRCTMMHEMREIIGALLWRCYQQGREFTEGILKWVSRKAPEGDSCAHGWLEKHPRQGSCKYRSTEVEWYRARQGNSMEIWGFSESRAKWMRVQDETEPWDQIGLSRSW